MLHLHTSSIKTHAYTGDVQRHTGTRSLQLTHSYSTHHLPGHQPHHVATAGKSCSCTLPERVPMHTMLGNSVWSPGDIHTASLPQAHCYSKLFSPPFSGQCCHQVSSRILKRYSAKHLPWIVLLGLGISWGTQSSDSSFISPWFYTAILSA